jgi:hypothetical protein
MDYEWVNFDQGKTIKQKGTEGGKVIRDEENTWGARISLEGKGDIAPFSITLGIYGLMFHTKFISTLEQGQECFNLYKQKIEAVLIHYEVAKEKRDESWNKRHDELVEEILQV